MKDYFRTQIERCSTESQMYLDLGLPVNKIVNYLEKKYPNLMIESKQKKMVLTQILILKEK